MPQRNAQPRAPGDDLAYPLCPAWSLSNKQPIYNRLVSVSAGELYLAASKDADRQAMSVLRPSETGSGRLSSFLPRSIDKDDAWALLRKLAVRGIYESPDRAHERALHPGARHAKIVILGRDSGWRRTNTDSALLH